MSESARAAALPHGVEQAFSAIAGELGMASAAWLFVRAVAREAGDDGVVALADRLSASFTVADAIARMWLDGEREPKIDADAVLRAIGKSTRLVIVGIEATFLDALLAKASPDLKIAMIAHSAFDVDWQRVLDNFRGRVERVDLDTFQNWAGHRSALLTFAYGIHGARARVLPLWLRACGSDVRSQFRALIAWEVLGRAPELYPRWLVETDADQFTHVVR